MSEFQTPLTGMRFQSQLGKELKRMYKEGDNVVALSFAEVIKVNYKYNTVDVITTQNKNSTTKNPNDNGRYSARLPVAFGGRTPSGKVYGSNTLVTVGSKVLIGFVEGNKDTPIVINIYGAVDNQSMLTRTTMTSGDESDESVQQELWQLFNLYPSMTYENIDGRGNREVTFSGKTFLYVTDTDQNNEYVQDEAFDYIDLPSSRYSNGELIEPESPKAPTLLFVHQGIYEKHRFTVFIKSDGTFRMGSRNVNGHGITYQQMNPDGSFSIVKKNDTTNPEEESYDQSSMEILKNGNVLLQNPKHKFEITEEGIMVDGKPIGSGGGGGGGTNPEYDKAIKQINDTIELMSITMKAVEGGLETKVEKDTYEIDLEEVRGAQDKLLADIKATIASLKEALEDLRSFVSSSFPDGKVTDARKVELNKKLQNVDTFKSTLDIKYNEVMVDPFLPDTFKNILKTSKDRVDGFHQALHNVIDASITDGTLTTQEKADIDTAITNYINSLTDVETVFTSCIEESIKERIKEAVENPVNYANKEMMRQSSIITQLFNSISLKVSSEQLSSQVQDLEAKMATKEEQKAITDELERVEGKIDGALSNLPYRVEVLSTNGTVFVNDVIDAIVYCKIYKGLDDITSTASIGDIIWTRVSDNQASDESWNANHIGIGESFRLSVNDVRDRATFFCTYKNPPTATGSLTVANLKDVSVSPVEPTSPRDGSMWFNTTDGKLYVWLDGRWQFSAEGLDFNIRNLFTHSRDCMSGGWSFDKADRTNSQYQGTYIIETDKNWGSADYAGSDLFTRGVVKVDDKVTYCVLARLTGATGVSKDLKFYCDTTTVHGKTIGQVTTEWQQFYITFKVTSGMNSGASKIRVEVADLEAQNLKLQTCSPILVQGSSKVNWVPAPEDTQRELDNINTSVNSLGDDTKLTRFERGLIRSTLADITGTYYNPSDTLATLAQIDSVDYRKGRLYSIRQQARNIGLDTETSPTYKPLGEAYTALTEYLSGFTPKPWDVTSSAIVAIPDRVVWNQKWNDYNNLYSLFEIEVQDRQKEFTEQKVGEMKDETIAAISTAGNHETVAITDPTHVTPPIATLGLPEFEGNHVDSWDWNGRNYVLKSGEKYTWEGTKGTDNLVYKTLHPLSKEKFSKQKVTLSIAYKLTNISYGTTNPWVGMQLEVGYTDGTSYYPTCLGGTLGGTSTSDFVKHTATYQFELGKTVNYLTLSLGGRDLTGKVEIQNYKIEVGDKTAETVVYTPAPEDVWFSKGNRIRPVTNPLFSSGTDLTILGKFYGDGVSNDKFYWDTNGSAVKVKRWMDVRLDNKQNWSFSSDASGFKRVKAEGFTYANAVPNSEQIVKYDGSFLVRDNATTTADTEILSTSNNTLWVAVSDNDSGWGETYTPLVDEIKAYFLGWRMCDGTLGGKYIGSGAKVWYPVGDKDLSRIVTGRSTAPTEASPSITDKSINHYQVVYQLVDPILETVDFDGILELLAKDNVVTLYYPDWTPPIRSGLIKYGINLATVSQDTRYIIPSMVKRISSAEQKITDDAITSTVFNSREYSMALSNKANASDLGNYATKGEMDDVANGVDGKIQDALDKIDFSPYATKSELEQTALDFTAKFSATGGMNVIKNSIGYSELDFWNLFNVNKVDTITTAVLESLGFGKGFHFKADGQQKGITQTVSVIPNQPYTLGWYLNKMTKSETEDSNFRFWIQVLNSTGAVTHQIENNSTKVTNGFESGYMTFTPTTETITVSFIGYSEVEAILSGIMLNIGDVPLQWTLATGELYNTNVRMNINGLRVYQLDEHNVETGFTQMTPKEFAGYYLNNGSYEKVFYLNGDETVTKKLKATKEITLGTIKVLEVNSADIKGWAFVPNSN